ncbi:MAG: helix-turn-helix transcriptional regulator [Archangiaceae bacterium]|nr:helix-turn-helix transcriptional regulator [Archangiaceae bacterium]
MGKCVDSQCSAFQHAIALLGRPWTALILNVLQQRPLRFNELKAAAAGPTDKVLSTRLKELEAKGLLARSVEAGPPVRVAYSLTAQGKAFNDVAKAIERWGRAL